MLRKRGTNAKNIDPIKYLLDQPGLWRKDAEQRFKMTTSCRDTDYIPKVKDAGKIIKTKDGEVQIMHEGTKVKLGGYHGEWMAKIIKELDGHHEPQEEKVFHEILKRLKSGAIMMEMGSFWAYYSLWFARAIKDSVNICCEPDPTNLKIGKDNAGLNNQDLKFVQSAVGQEDSSRITIQLDSDQTKSAEVEVRTVDSLMKEYKIDHLDMLHIDVQGFEMDALKSAIRAIENKKIRFVVVSTHHYFFSGNPNTHNECLSFLRDNGANIISSHTVAESFSGDGLIAASFDPIDKDFKVETSISHTDNSLFRSNEDDVALLAELVRGMKS